MRRRTRLATALAVATLAGLLWAGLGPGHDRERSATAVASASAFASLPASPSPALEIGRPARLSSSRYLSRWSVIRVPAVAHATPSARSAVVARLATRTPEATADVVPVLGARTGTDGRVWVEVRLPVLPNGSVGWVQRRSLGGYQTVDTHLIIDTERLHATLYRAGVRIFDAPVGVGAAGSPTPRGEFTVRSRLTRYASPFYGPVAFGTTARSAVLTDWPDGGYIGIHGTNEPGRLPGRISHGCIRLRNGDILRLAALMPVGTPVTIR
jgi:lipoprotein-anchoring transpeptidase ErfK/SrfK